MVSGPVQLLPLPRTPRADDAKPWTNVLREVPIFSDLNARHLRKVAALGKIQRFHEGATMMQAGQPANAMYVILDGSVSVRPPGRRAVTVGVGSFVGELALLDNGPRTARVVALEPVTTLCVLRSAFRRLLRAEPSIAVAIAEELARRLRSTAQ
jgi:CRP-like cAMP-binding protein